jgi:tetratricopeptide (TPR) repeat protein
MSTSSYVRATSFCLAVSLGAISCTRDPAVLKQRYLSRANQAFNEKRYSEAVIDYKRALQQDPRFAEARYKLAQTYEKLGDGINAGAEYVRAADLMPNDPDAQVRAGAVLLAGGAFEDAKKRALNALAKNPRHVEAQLVLAQAMVGLKDMNGAVAQIEQDIRLDPSEPRMLDALGHFHLLQGDTKAAESAFKRAVALDQHSLAANLGLARFYLSTGQMPEAEDWLKKSVNLAPDDYVANRALATIYLSTNRLAEAEAPLAASVSHAPTAEGRLVLVDYYLLMNRNDDARRLLESMKNDPSLFVATRLRLSTLEWRSGKHAEAQKWVDEVLAKNTHDAEANVLKGRYLLLDGNVDQARDRFKAAIDSSPQLGVAHYWLGVVYQSHGDFDGARNEYAQLQKLDPTDVASKLQLAQISVQQGKLGEAEIFINEAIKVQPRHAGSHLALIDVLVAQGKLAPALTVANWLSTNLPTSPDPQMRLGRIYLKQRDYPAAERAFRRAMELSNGGPDAVTGLVDTYLASGKLADAQRVVEERVGSNPKDAQSRVLAARVYDAQREPAKAETALKSALAADPKNLNAYMQLGRIYFTEKRLDDGRKQLEAIVAQQPKAVWAHTMIAMSLQVQNRVPEARQRYEQILALDPHAAIAANNLAMLLLADKQNIDRALELAQNAKQQLPDDPNINDTLGLVFLEKGLGGLAVPPLRISVEKEPSNAVFQYHLGQAYAQIGQKTEARATLERAVALKADFEGAADARRLLTGLSDPVGKAPARP